METGNTKRSSNMEESGINESSSNFRSRKAYLSSNVTPLNYRKELTACKGNQKLKRKRRKSVAVKKRQAQKKAEKRRQIERTKKFTHRSDKRSVKFCDLHKSRKCLRRDGKCGLNDVNILKKQPEVCRRYSNGHCPSGETCRYMHSEFPCKFYHLGNNCFAGEQCLFSHAPLNKKSRQILMDFMEKINDRKKSSDQLVKKSAEFESSKSPSLPEASKNDSRIVKEESSKKDSVSVNFGDVPRLNFYVDTLKDCGISKEQKPSVEVDFGNLFVDTNTDIGNSAEASPSLEIDIEDTPDVTVKNEAVSPPSPVFVKHGKILDPIKEAQKQMKLQLRNTRSNFLTNSMPLRSSELGNEDRGHPEIVQFLSVSSSKSEPDEDNFKNFLLKNFNVVGMFQFLIEEAQKKKVCNDFSPSFEKFWENFKVHK